MNYSYLGVFLLALITVTFFAPLFIERSYRRVETSKEEIERKVLKQMANKAFALYALGVVMYVAGLFACLPLLTLAVPGDFPSIARFEDHGLQTYVVIFSRITLDNSGFVVYYFIFQPLCLILAAIGIRRFEKSRDVMHAIERLMKERGLRT